MSYFEKVKTMADKNNPIAQKSLGDMYRNNYGVKRDSQEAIRWWRKAAQQGYMEAQYELGYALYPPCYMDNEPNKQEGLMWLTKAADLGHLGAQYSLGCAYYFQHGEESDREAIKRLQKPAELGNADAQSLLGDAYLCLGIKGEKINYREAIKWYQKAIDQKYNNNCLPDFQFACESLARKQIES